MAKANQKLSELHVALIDYLLLRLTSCKVVVEGVEQIIPLPAAELGVMAKLLKDNGIVADKDHANDLEKLQAALNAELTGSARNDILSAAVNKIADDSGFMH
ncbi:hypothetical protein [Pantoea phage LIMEzero]|uniref:Terminase small subunit n=1 Tax=Pantoea phage LIMEzero TaxID=943335 RepID=F4N9V2_9CAUD|nr:terminase small subunit [Pantoea phage LIMEzero]CBY88580.1 hypothetical protein [Pantoea phage LIMEzero]